MIVVPLFRSAAAWPVLGDGNASPHFGLLQTKLLPSLQNNVASRMWILSKHWQPLFPPKITAWLLLLAPKDNQLLPTTVALDGEETRNKAGNALFSIRQK
jgi:hypothetical protein